MGAVLRPADQDGAWVACGAAYILVARVVAMVNGELTRHQQAIMAGVVVGPAGAAARGGVSPARRAFQQPGASAAEQLVDEHEQLVEESELLLGGGRVQQVGHGAQQDAQ